MATAVIQTAAIKTTHSRSIQHLVLGWVLMFPLVFLAVHGTPSFEGAGNKNVGTTPLSGLGSNGRNAGIVGSVVIPGIAYLIVVWLLMINARRVIAQALQ